MANELRLRRGTAAATQKFVGAVAEVTVDVDRHGLVVHDGKTPGGFPVPTEQESAHTVPAYAGLRAYKGRASTVCINQVGVGGTFFHDAADRSSKDDGGLVLVDAEGRRWKRMEVSSLSPFIFGGRGDGVAIDTDALKGAAAAAVRTGLPLDLRGGTWKIDDQVDLTGVRTIRADFYSAILVERSGSISDSYAVLIGRPGSGDERRTNGVVIEGQLSLVCSSRKVAQCGLYVKGSWFHAGHLHADNFNGTGIHLDSVWDSTATRLRVERSGNVKKFALVVNSVGDTSNCFNISSLQCEASYHRGLDISAIRGVIQNIHCERTHVLTLDDGTPALQSGKKYVNHRFALGNCDVRQALIDAVPAGTGTPDQTTKTVAAELSVTAYLDASEWSSVMLGGDLNIVGGNGATFSGLSVANVYQRAPAGDTVFNSLYCPGRVALEHACTVNAPRLIGLFNPYYNGVLIRVFGGAVKSVSFTEKILGDISFFGSSIGEVANTGSPVEGRSATTFAGCAVETVTGAADAAATFNGGFVSRVALQGRAKFSFNAVVGRTFGSQGLRGYVTVGCSFDGVTDWGTPQLSYKAGTRTSRIGFAAGLGADYVNADGAVNWRVLANFPS